MVEMTDEHPSLLVGGLEARPLSRPRSPMSPRVSAPLLRECGTLDTIRGYGDTRTALSPQTNHIVSTSRDMCITPPDGTTAHHITSHMGRTRSAYGRGCASMASRHRHALHHTVVPSATGRCVSRRPACVRTGMMACPPARCFSLKAEGGLSEAELGRGLRSDG